MADYSKTRIQFRRGTAAELSAANPKLGVGEPAFATDTNVLKIGDGSENYNDLSGITGGGGGGGGSMSNLTDDSSPQLGGDLDVHGKDFLSSSGIFNFTTATGSTTPIINLIPPASHFDTEIRLHTNNSGTTYQDLINDGGTLKLRTNDSNPIGIYTNGQERINISNGGVIKFNQTGDSYKFPTTRGSANQFLQTDVNGDMTFESVDTTNFSSSTLVTESEGIASNDNDTTIPTSAAVKDYIDTNVPSSDTSSTPNSTAVTNIVMISQSNYDNLSSVDANTVYFIT